MSIRTSVGLELGHGACLWTLIVLTSCSWTADAESLQDAWRMALGTDETLAAAHSEREAAEADHSAASRMRWPALDAAGTRTEFRDAPILDIETPGGRLQAPIWRHDAYTTAGADLSVPIWTSGRISGAIGMTAAGARGAMAQEASSVADIKLGVAESYVAIFRTRRALIVAESSVTSLGAHADDVQVMYDKGAVPQADLLSARVALANAIQLRLRATNALHLSIAAYNRQVGQPLDRSPDLEEPSATPSVAAGGPLAQLIANAHEHRPELAAIAAEEDRLEQAARAERAQGLPQLVVHAAYTHLDNQILDRENFASVRVEIQWRLFDSGQAQARTGALRLRARAAQHRLADARSAVALEVETAVLMRDDAAARVSATTGAVAQAEENLRMAKELYAGGLGTNTQALDADTLRATALTNRDDAAFDLLIAGYRVQKAIGEL